MFERRPGVRGGKGTSQPNLTMAEKKPPMMPTMTVALRRRRDGSVEPRSVVIHKGLGTSDKRPTRVPAVDGRRDRERYASTSENPVMRGSAGPRGV